MKNTVSKYVQQFREDHHKRRRMGAIWLMLAVLVAVGVSWNLHVTGIAMTNETFCGMEEHQHDASCWESVLVCGKEEGETDAVYETQTTLTCTLSESEGHTHDADCYETQEVLVSGSETPHVHTEDCYEEVLTCGLEEHTHTVECLMDETADVESSSDWEATLPNLTGVWADDVVAIAQSQLGYTESTANFQLAEDSETRQGYTRYGEWYGNAYGDWDAMFASFCLCYAGVDETLFPSVSGAYAWQTKLEEMERYADAVDAEPAAGDLVFFDKDGDGRADTVGVVTEVTENGQLTIIEGNYTDGDTDAVCENTYSIGEKTILGYGILPEQESVEAEADAEEADDALTFTADADGVTVTVTAPAGALPEGAKLTAALLDENGEEFAAAAQLLALDEGSGMTALDISFTVDGEKTEPTDTVTVSIDFSAVLPADVDMEGVQVWHLDESGDQTKAVLVADVAGEADGSIDAETAVAAFTTKSFSTFGVTYPEETTDDEEQGESSNAGIALTSDGSSSNSSSTYGASLATNAANSWQIVSEGYAGNTSAYKTAYGTDGNVRVQKNVVPTDVENEFLVYMSIDLKELFADYFETAAYQATTSNNFHDAQLGTVVEDMTGNEKVIVTGNQTSGYNSATFNIISSSGELLAAGVKLYWSQANNVTFYLKVSDTQYILFGVKVDKDSENTVMLSEEAEELIMSAVANAVTLNYVTDVMGDNIEFVELVSGDYDSNTTYNSSSRTLTWVPVIKSDFEIDKVKTDESKSVTYTDHSGNVKTVTAYKYVSWALNVSELVYKVRLNVTADGFNSCGNNMNSTTTDNCSYAVNNSAILYYSSSDSSGTATFQVPYVRGLLYDVSLLKQDDTGNNLSGAKFSLTASSDNVYSDISQTVESNPYVSFTGLPWGSYTLTETEAPAGYSISDQSSWEMKLCYTTNPYVLELSNDGHMRYKGNDNTDTDGDNSNDTWVVKNILEVVLPETGGAGTYLYTLTGLLFIISAACLLYKYNLRKKERE